MLPGNVPVKWKFTVSNETLASCAQECNLKTVVTARGFLEKVKIQRPGEILFIEDVAKDAGFGERVAAALAASLLPTRAGSKYNRGALIQRRAAIADRKF